MGKVAILEAKIYVVLSLKEQAITSLWYGYVLYMGLRPSNAHLHI